ncbi:MAG TPA: pitrilysin family protein [Terracidiphilus sp.]|nr:pitrilysin family protein [Terracidiphilus sp.]
MKTLAMVCALLFVAAQSWAQKEVQLPKDLPSYGPERPLSAPSVKIAKLDNGLTVWLVSEPGFPKVSFSFAVRGGLAADPSDRPGLSQLLGNTIDQGTKTLNAEQIAQQLQAAGGDLSANPGKDSILLSISVLSARQNDALTVLSDLTRNAIFPDAEVILAKRNAADQLRQQESQPSFVAGRAMAKILFGDHPYHVTSATQGSISASTPDDLRKIYAERFRPDQALLVAVGDFESDKMLDAVKSRFGEWKSPSTSPVSDPGAPSVTPQHAIYVIPRPGSVQTTLELGAFGPLRNAEDYEAARVATAIYGGTFGSRLVRNIREDKGYTYSPFAVMRNYQAAGMLISQADVRNAVTAPSLNEILYELNRMVTTSPTTDELDTAKRFLVGIEAIQLQARSAVSDELARLWVSGLQPDAIGTYGRKVAAITSQDVDTAAKKYFPAAKTAIVAVGEEKVVRDALAPFGLPLNTAP